MEEDQFPATLLECHINPSPIPVLHVYSITAVQKNPYIPLLASTSEGFIAKLDVMCRKLRTGSTLSLYL